MTTIIAPKKTSILSNGLFELNGKFYNRFNDEVTTEWAVYLVWVEANSKHGHNHANTIAENFKKKHNIN